MGCEGKTNLDIGGRLMIRFGPTFQVLPTREHLLVR